LKIIYINIILMEKKKKIKKKKKKKKKKNYIHIIFSLTMRIINNKYNIEGLLYIE